MIDWSKAPKDAETLEKNAGNVCWCKDGFWWNESYGGWVGKQFPDSWKTIATRPQPNIIDVADMKEGMIVRCVGSESRYYRVGSEYVVGTDKVGRFGPIDTYGEVTPCPEFYKFTLVSEPEQRKTVEDAVERLKSGGFENRDLIAFDSVADVFFGCDRSYKFDECQYQVCTREEFEACVSAKAESKPKWTHTYGSDNCYIKESEPDFQGYIVIYSEADGYMLVQPRELEPIKSKPTITKAQAEDVSAILGIPMERIEEGFDVSQNPQIQIHIHS